MCYSNEKLRIRLFTRSSEYGLQICPLGVIMSDKFFKAKIQLFPGRLRELVLVLLAFAWVLAPAHLQAGSNLDIQGGEVDWSKWEIRAWGQADVDCWPVQDRLGRGIVQRQALLRAHSMLWKTLLQVRVRDRTSLGELLDQFPQMKEEFQGLVHNSLLLGVIRQDNGTVEVRTKLLLTGPLLEKIFARLSWTGTSSKQQSNSTMPFTNVHDFQVEQAATGIVVDARGTGFKPVLFVTLEDEQGWQLLDGQRVDTRVVIDKGMVGYAPDVKAAYADRRVAGNPLLIRAIALKGDDHLVLLQEQADFLREQPSFESWMKQGRVVVVWDDQKVSSVLEYQLY